MSETRLEAVTVDDGAVPVWTAGPSVKQDAAAHLPGLVIVPSIFGPNDDLLAQMRGLSDVALTVVIDPFWRQGGGAIDYGQHDAAVARLAGFERSRCRDDIAAVTAWTAAQTNGNVVGLGICFGGPWVLIGAAKSQFSAAATWHGSRMEDALDRLDGLEAPLRLHFGEIDPVTPPEAIAAISERFADHADCRIVVHPGADHGFSHEGHAWDPDATAVALADLRGLLVDAAG